MSNDVKRLRFYLTYKMALELLGISKGHRPRIHRLIKSGDLDSVHVAGMTLVDRENFEEIAGPFDEEVRWPPHLGTLDIDDFITAEHAARILGVSRRRITQMGNDFQIESYDLSHWGGKRVYSKSSILKECRDRELSAHATKLKAAARYK